MPHVKLLVSRMSVSASAFGKLKSWTAVGPPNVLPRSTAYVAKSAANMMRSVIR